MSQQEIVDAVKKTPGIKQKDIISNAGNNHTGLRALLAKGIIRRAWEGRGYALFWTGVDL
jgi:hypothetical protein